MAPREIKEKSPPPFFEFPLLVLLLSFLILSPWFFGLNRFRDQLAAEVFVFGLFLISCPFLDWKSLFKPRVNEIDFLVFLTWGLGLFYVLFSSLPAQSLSAFLRLSSCVLFYLLVRGGVGSEARLRLFLWAILLAGVFYSIYGLFQYYDFLPHPFWYQPHSLASRFVNGGHFGAFLFFPLFMGLALLISIRKFLLQGLVVSFLLVMGWALLLSRSRAVWICFSLGLFIFFSLAWRTRLLNRKMILGSLLFLGGGGLFLWTGGGVKEILERFQELGQALYSSLEPQATRFYSLLYRAKIWKGAWGAILENPWGWGLGTFSSIFPQFRVHGDRFFVDYAHNEFLQVGVDLGIPGLLLLMGFLFFYSRRAFIFLKANPVTSFQKAVGGGFFALWIGLVLASQVDFPLRVHVTSLFSSAFLALSAYLFGLQEIRPKTRFIEKSPNPHGRAYLLRGFSFVLVFLMGVFTAGQLFAEIHFERGQGFEKEFAWDRALREYEKAAGLSPFHPLYQEALGSLYQRKALISFNRSEKKNFRKRSIEAYQKAIRHHPYKATSHYLLASAYEAEGEIGSAQTEFKKAVALEPANPFYLSEYGYFALRHSLAEEAIRAFEKLKVLPFQEGVKTHPCEVVRSCYRVTQNYEDLKRVIPEDWQGHQCLGVVLGENGQWVWAQKEFDILLKQARALYDYDYYKEHILGFVVNFYLAHHRLDEARQIYQEALLWNPQDGEIQRKLEELPPRTR